MKFLHSTWIICGLIVLLQGCTTVDRSGTTLATLEKDGLAANEQHQSLLHEVIDRLSRRVVARKDSTLDLLLLSGGGQHGAYGMGFLRGWSERSQMGLPKFDLVSGVSTGALQATFAFLGTPEDIELGAAIYRCAASEYAPSFDWLFWAHPNGGVLNIDRYRFMIQKFLNPEVQSRLNAQFANDRQLLIATTNFDLGVGKMWNLGAEIGSSTRSLERAHRLLLAATSIPGLFPHQIVDGHLHLDGAVVSNLLPVLDLDGYRMLARKLEARGVISPVKVRIWVIINLWTHPRLMAVDPNNRSEIEKRSGDLFFSLAQPQMLERLRELAAAVNRGVPHLRMEVRVTSIPNSWANEDGALDLMNLKWMQKLEVRGYERAKGPKPWEEITSSFERPN